MQELMSADRQSRVQNNILGVEKILTEMAQVSPKTLHFFLFLKL
jgi:hypothetical protein